jgi:L-lactate utilization protein LutC
MDYDTLASKETITATMEALKANNFESVNVATGADALALIKERIPQGASVMNGASKTLEAIGYVEYLKAGQHGWNNLHDAILAEKDPEKQANLRKHSVVSDFYTGSVHALSQTGEMIIASNTGSQLPHLVYTSPNLILVVGAQKIVPSIAEGFNRIDKHILPLEDANMKSKYGVGTLHAKTVILHKENPMMGRKILVIIVNEKLGF